MIKWTAFFDVNGYDFAIEFLADDADSAETVAWELAQVWKVNLRYIEGPE